MVRVALCLGLRPQRHHDFSKIEQLGPTPSPFSKMPVMASLLNIPFHAVSRT